MIWVAFIMFGFLAFTLRSWLLLGRRDSFKEELKDNLILSMVIAAMAAVMIFINN
jgi:carbon starvation protein CstA